MFFDNGPTNRYLYNKTSNIPKELTIHGKLDLLNAEAKYFDNGYKLSNLRRIFGSNLNKEPRFRPN